MTPPALAVLPEFSTGGCNGAAGFLRCDVTNRADSIVAPTVSRVALVLRTKLRTLDRDGGLQEWDLFVRRPQDLARVGAEVPAQDLLVHGPKVD